MPYAKVDGGVAVLYENEWYLCTPVGRGSGEGVISFYGEPAREGTNPVHQRIDHQCDVRLARHRSHDGYLHAVGLKSDGVCRWATMRSVRCEQRRSIYRSGNYTVCLDRWHCHSRGLG